MRRLLLGLLLLNACSGANVVAGEEKTKAEQLEAALPSWCQRACNMLSTCEGQGDCACSGDECVCNGSIDDDCPQECAAEMGRWAQGSDECAAIGERLKRCIDDNGCDVVSVQGICPVTEEERDMCPELDDLDAPSGDPKAGDIDSPPQGATGGSSSAGPNPGGSPGAPVANPIVYCEEGYGSGGGMPIDPAGPIVLCEEGHLSCTDGHVYRLLCAMTSEGQSSCSCFIDDQVTRSFDPHGECPTPAQINTGCGWYLAE